jgi:ribose transport system ATP-binding protein
MAQLKAEGVTLVYISHKLDEVERITDEVIVMRDGRSSRAAHGRADAPRDGQPDGGPRAVRPVPAQGARARRPRRCCGARLQRAGLGAGRELRGAPGEILGFAGLVGAGRTELFEGLLGLRPRSAGEVDVAGKPWCSCATRATPPTKASPT